MPLRKIAPTLALLCALPLATAAQNSATTNHRHKIRRRKATQSRRKTNFRRARNRRRRQNSPRRAPLRRNRNLSRRHTRRLGRNAHRQRRRTQRQHRRLRQKSENRFRTGPRHRRARRHIPRRRQHRLVQRQQTIRVSLRRRQKRSAAALHRRSRRRRIKKTHADKRFPRRATIFARQQNHLRPLHRKRHARFRPARRRNGRNRRNQRFIFRAAPRHHRRRIRLIDIAKKSAANLAGRHVCLRIFLVARRPTYRRHRRARQWRQQLVHRRARHPRRRHRLDEIDLQAATADRAPRLVSRRKTHRLHRRPDERRAQRRRRHLRNSKRRRKREQHHARTKIFRKLARCGLPTTKSSSPKFSTPILPSLSSIRKIPPSRICGAAPKASPQVCGIQIFPSLLMELIPP